ncbi:MAG: hypothetical protein JWN93_1626 [Hyphomicrobiales bacterium]|jgi:hypothetical protein|nr:hypothetical protein [Hyphomicrobiales bacterium]
MPRQENIRSRAYALWEQEGRPEGRALEHWERAEREAGSKEPAAGPHAKPELTNPMATPGAGMLPDPDAEPESQEAPSG